MNRKELENLLAYSRIIEEQYEAAQKAEIYVAALALGCCLAECLLLMRAISSITQIQTVPKYTAITVKQLCSDQWGLFRLTDLALEMKWLNFKHLDNSLVEEFIKKVNSVIPIPDGKRATLERIIPTLLLHIARKTRNTIHAGKVASQLNTVERGIFLENADGNCAIVNLVLVCLRDTQNESAMGLST